jgi:predicted O-methyltransferase YrrM
MAALKTSERLLESLADSEDAEFIPIWRECQPFTMTSLDRGLALYRATRYIVEQRVPGTIVECGVWKGGSVMIAMRTLQLLDAAPRRFILFDTFAGMTEPGPLDEDYRGRHARELLIGDPASRDTELVRAAAPLAEVQNNLARIGYPADKYRFIQGDVARTIPQANLPAIALLRLDTDFYASTYIELMYLYPRLVRQGVLIIDDYGHWKGARRAVDDYFAEAGDAPKPRPPRPFLNRIDYTGRLAIRGDEPPDELPPEIAKDPTQAWARPARGGVTIPRPDERYDFVPPGLADPGLIQLFPTLTEADPRRNKWPYLRIAAPHRWRFDTRSRNQHIGVVSLEEAILLYHLARPFAGQRGLAIGCHFAWSTAHMLAAGLDLDVVDPKLASLEQMAAVRESLNRIPTSGSFQLWAAYSPSIIPALRARRPEPWSFVFIDGDHEGDAPRLDAEAVLPHCAANAAVAFHDLISPDVTAGLTAFRAAGWQTRIHNTMQVMGVAWRGDCLPVDPPPDPRMPPIVEDHLLANWRDVKTA